MYQYYDDPDDRAPDDDPDENGFYQWAYECFDDDFDDFDPHDDYDDEGVSIFSIDHDFYEEPPNLGECSMCGGDWSLNQHGRCSRCEQVWNS